MLVVKKPIVSEYYKLVEETHRLLMISGDHVIEVKEEIIEIDMDTKEVLQCVVILEKAKGTLY